MLKSLLKLKLNNFKKENILVETEPFLFVTELKQEIIYAFVCFWLFISLKQLVNNDALNLIYTFNVANLPV